VVAELVAAGATGLGLHDPKPEQLDLLAGLPQLRALDIRNARRLRDADLAKLAALPELRLLNLDSADELTTAGLKHLAGLKRLDLLRLTGAPGVGGTPLGELKGSAITQLDLSGCWGILTLDGVSQLSLRRLALDGCLALGDAGLAELSGQETLEALSLRGCPLTDAGLAPLPASLRRLELAQTAISSAGLTALLARTPQLERLGLAGCANLDGATAAALAARESLRQLDLREARWLGAEELRAIGGLPKLEALDLSGVALDSETLGGLDGAATLRRLSLNGCGALPKTAGQTLSSLEALERLDLSGAHLNPEDFEHLATLSNLRQLDLSSSLSVGVSALRELGSLRLEVLNLAGCRRVDAAAQEILSGWTSLRELDVVGCRLGAEATQALREALPDCTIRSLN
jgi:hypothetical protein